MENNFEKQVQKKMDELKLTPADDVWQKVATAITKRNNSRRIFAIVFLFLLFITSAIFIFMDKAPGTKAIKMASEKNKSSENKSNIESMNNTNSRQRSKDVNGSITTKGNSNDSIQVIKDFPVAKKIGEEPMSAQVRGNTLVTKDKSGYISTVKTSNRKGEVNDNAKKEDYKMKPKINTLIISSDQADLAGEVYKTNDTTGKTIAGVPLIKGTTKNETADTISNAEMGKQKRATDTSLITLKTVHEKNINKNLGRVRSKNDWKIGFNFALGITTTKNSYLGSIGLGNGDESNTFDLSQSTVGSPANPGTVTSTSYFPSKIKKGAGLILGAYIQKSISPKIDFLLGLNYKAYSSAMIIGNRVDSINIFSRNNFFYRSGNGNRYKNHFYFIEVPVTFRFQLSKNKIPLYFTAGISITQLVGSNALQFDTLSGTYYKNNVTFNKTLVSMSGGLLISISAHRKNALLVGPGINFSLNKMSNSGLYKDRHYSFFGILMQKSIGKK